MRIYFAVLAQAEALARRVASVTHVPLRKARDATAAMMGYHNWSELKEVTEAGAEQASLPDEMCSTDVIHSRVLFHIARLVHALEIDEEAAVHALSRIRPTTAFFLRYAESESPIDMMLPRLWTGSAQLEEGAERYIAEIGGRAQADTLAELALGKEEGTAILDPVNGVRVLAAYRGQPQDGLQPGEPYAILGVRFVPLVQEQVLTHIEIRLLTFMCAEDITEEGMEFIGSAIIGYLNQRDIHWQCDGKLCGAAHGIHLSLHGTITTDEERAFIEVLDAQLCKCEERWMEMEGCSVLSTDRQSLLPIASFDNLIEDDGMDDDEVQIKMPSSADEAEEVQEIVCSAMRQAPARLGEYLCTHGKADFADFARAHTVATTEGVGQFLEFVQTLEHAGAIPIDVAVFIQNHYISGEATDTDEALEIEPDSSPSEIDRALAKRFHRFADRAAQMRCKNMEKHYREMTPDEIVSSINAGLQAFLGNGVER